MQLFRKTPSNKYRLQGAARISLISMLETEIKVITTIIAYWTNSKPQYSLERMKNHMHRCDFTLNCQKLRMYLENLFCPLLVSSRCNTITYWLAEYFPKLTLETPRSATIAVAAAITPPTETLKSIVGMAKSSAGALASPRTASSSRLTLSASTKLGSSGASSRGLASPRSQPSKPLTLPKTGSGIGSGQSTPPTMTITPMDPISVTMPSGTRSRRESAGTLAMVSATVASVTRSRSPKKESSGRSEGEEGPDDEGSSQSRRSKLGSLLHFNPRVEFVCTTTHTSLTCLSLPISMNWTMKRPRKSWKVL